MLARTAGYTWTNYKTNTQITKELKITQIRDKLLEYKRNWIQHVNRIPRNILLRVMKHYSPTGRRNNGRPLKRLLDMCNQNGSTSGPTAWQIYDDDDDNNNNLFIQKSLTLQPFRIGHMFIKSFFFWQWPLPSPPKVFTVPPETPCIWM